MNISKLHQFEPVDPMIVDESADGVSSTRRMTVYWSLPLFDLDAAEPVELY